MNRFALFIVLTTLSSCGHIQAAKNTYNIRPGEVRWIEFPIKSPETKLICRGEEIKYMKDKNVGRALIVSSYFSDLTPFKCHLKNDQGLLEEFKFTVENREYKAEQLKVDPKKIKLNPKDQNRVWEEQQHLNKIYASSMPYVLFYQGFREPMERAITSVYGTKRVYNNEKKGQHLGIDYRAPVGDKVPSANAGKIVYAGDLFYTGWTVIIDHGLDIFTVYGHLSKVLVKTGAMVGKGEVIGLSGNTGRTSGPHLHWGVKVQGQYIDGLVLIDETKKYFLD